MCFVRIIKEYSLSSCITWSSAFVTTRGIVACSDLVVDCSAYLRHSSKYPKLSLFSLKNKHIFLVKNNFQWLLAVVSSHAADTHIAMHGAYRFFRYIFSFEYHKNQYFMDNFVLNLDSFSIYWSYLKKKKNSSKIKINYTLLLIKNNRS